jgi:hypothetical protein
MQKWMCAVLFVVLLVGRGHRAEAQAPNTPKAAAVSFAKAIMKGDLTGVKAVSIYEGDAVPIVEVIVGMMGTQNRLDAAAKAKFGAKGSTVAESMRMPDLAKLIEGAKFVEEGDTAKIVEETKQEPLSTSSTPAFTLRKVSGQWKVELTSLGGGEGKEEMEQKKPMMIQIQKLQDETTAAIKAGKYKTAKQAKAAYEDKMFRLVRAAAPKP